MRRATTRAELAAALSELERPLALVPTMGALHAGHATLIREARDTCRSVVVSIFVNPMQFGANEDLGRYPRPIENDLAMCAGLGADAVWTPEHADVYAAGRAQVTVDSGPLGQQLEGAFRPTHFAGVLTVVAKYFSLLRPDVGVFGEKDYQQLVLVRRMSADLDLGVEVRGVPTVREPDGLAVSSRNVYLSTEDRDRAVVLSAALFAGRDAAADGAGGVVSAANAVLAARPGVDVDYLQLRGADLGDIPERGPARLLVAARVGTTRLIDNVGVQL